MVVEAGVASLAVEDHTGIAPLIRQHERVRAAPATLPEHVIAVASDLAPIGWRRRGVGGRGRDRVVEAVELARLERVEVDRRAELPGLLGARLDARRDEAGGALDQRPTQVVRGEAINPQEDETLALRLLREPLKRLLALVEADRSGPQRQERRCGR